MTDIDLGLLAQGPHAGLIRDIASRCAADDGIQAIWVGGSLAAGTGDQYSDVDLRFAVAPGQLERWTSPDWQRYLPLLPSGGLLLRFGERALLHHLLLHDGTIVDFYVQDTVRAEMARVGRVLAERHGFAYPSELEGVVKQFWNEHEDAVTRR